jgi:hypothetical protein
MVEVCVSRNMKIASGVLGIAKWSVPRHVADATFDSIGDGTLDPTLTLPGKLLIDGSVSWTSDSPIDTMVLFRLQRAYRDFVTSNPNAVQFRDRWTYKIGNGPQTPEIPDVSTVYNSQMGGAIDLGATNLAVPLRGRLYKFYDAHITEDFFGPVPTGQTITVRYRCYVWTPPPFSDNANSGFPLHEARARSARLQLITYPQQDTAVVNG